MMDLHSAVIAFLVFLALPLFLALLFVSSILAIMKGDESAFIGLMTAFLFMAADMWAIHQYLKSREEFLEKDIHWRVWRDAAAPVAISLLFLFFSFVNLMAGEVEVAFIFFILFLSLLIVGVVFYYQKKKINV